MGYIFITKEDRKSGNEQALVKEKWLLDILNLRNHYVKVIKEYKQAFKILKDKKLSIVMSDLQKEQSDSKFAVSYLNYVLDLHRLNFPDDKRKRNTIKSFGGLTYSNINSDVLNALHLSILNTGEQNDKK